MKAKELNGYYYCFSFDEWSHDLYSITEMSRKEAILTAIDNGVRLYLVKYRKGKQQSDRNVLTVAMDRVQKLGYVLVKHARYTAAEWDIDLKVNNLPLKHIEKKNPHVA